MANTPLIEAVIAGDRDALTRILAAGADVNEPGSEQDWTALNYAAGKGDVAMVQLLLDHDADPARIGLDQRTPYMIALAAGRIDVARLLHETEQQRQLVIDAHRAEAPYCRAYPLTALREFPTWHEEAVTPLTDDDIVFLHRDYQVTHGIWHGERVLFHDVTEAWTTFCHDRLGFRVPDDFDLLTT